MLGYLLSPTVQFEDTDGKPLVGGKVYVYKANTTTLATTYSDYNGTMNTNPIILDLLGHCTVIADDDEYYDIEVHNKDNVFLFSSHLVAVGGEGGSASVSGFDVKAGYGIKVGKSVSGNKEVFTVSADPTYLATKTDLNSKQNVLTPGDNISISGDTISVTGLKQVNVSAPLQKVDTVSSWDLSIDTSGIQTTLSAGTNIDEVKLSNGIVDLKHDNCSASINSIAIGQETVASGDYSFAEGYRTSALQYGNHAEGNHTIASGTYSHAEGYGSISIGYESHAEGYRTSAFDSQSHSEGDRTQAIGWQSHSEGYKTSAIGPASHAEGEGTIASGGYSHAEGDRTRSIREYSHAEGSQTSARGYGSHAEGYYTIASGDYQTVIGKYNAPNTTDLFQIGCGSTDNARQNAFEVKSDNTIWYNYNGAMTQLAPYTGGTGIHINSNQIILNNKANYRVEISKEYTINSNNEYIVLPMTDEFAPVKAWLNANYTKMTCPLFYTIKIVFDSQVQNPGMALLQFGYTVSWDSDPVIVRDSPYVYITKFWSQFSDAHAFGWIDAKNMTNTAGVSLELRNIESNTKWTAGQKLTVSIGFYTRYIA